MARALSILGWTAAVVVLLAAVIVGAVLTIPNTAGGRALIERWVPRLSSGTVRLSDLGGSFPAAIDLGRLQIADERGVWLSAQGIRVRWSPLALITERVRVATLQVERIDIDRRPVSHPRHEGGEVHLPEIDVKSLTIGTLALAPALAGVEAALSVRGRVHLNSLEDASGNLIARRTNGRGDYELTLRFDRKRMDATVHLEEPASGPLEHLAGLPGLGALSLTGRLAGPRGAEHVELQGQAGDAVASVAGTLDLTAPAADLTYQFDSPALTVRPGLAWQRLALKGDWHGSLRAPQAAAQLAIDALELPGGTHIGTLAAALSTRTGILALHARLERLAVPGPLRALLAASPLELDATMHVDEPARRVELDARDRLFALRAQVATVGVRGASFQLSVLDLGPFGALIRQSLQGKATLAGQVALDSRALRLSVNATSDLSGGTSRLVGLLGPRARLQLTASVTSSKVTVEQLTVSAPKLVLSTQGTADRSHGGAAIRALRAHWNLRVARLEALAPAVRGTLVMDGQLSGAPRALATEFEARSTLSVRGSPTGTVQAIVVLRGLPAAISGTVRAKGALAGSPLELGASLRRGPGDSFHFDVQRTDWRSVHIEGSLTTGSELAQGRGSIKLQIAQLADLQPLIGTAIAGSLDGTLALQSEAGHNDARLALQAHGLALAGFTANGRLSARGPIDALRVHLDADSPAVRGAPATLSAEAHLSLLGRTLDLEQVQANYRDHTLRLLSPARITFARGLRITQLRVGMGDAVAAIDGELLPELDASASLHGVGAALVNSFAPGMLAEGTFQAGAQLHGTLASPLGRATFTLAGLRAANAAARDLPALDARAMADLEGDRAAIRAELTAGRGSKLVVSGSAPLRRSAVFDLTLTGKLDAALANALLEAHGERAAGLVSVDAAVIGPPADPEIRGTVDLARGDLRDYAAGVHVSDVTARLVGGKGILRIESLTGKAGAGSLSVTGTIGVLEPHLPIDMRVSAKNAELVTSDILTANVNADVTLKGTLRQEIEIGGLIRVNRATVGIPNSLPPNVQVLDVRRAGEAPPPPPLRRLVVRLDVSLAAPQSIFVQGRGLNAQLGGTLTLHGTTDTPRVSGGFELIRGSFSLASSRLTFTSGEVSFNGAGLHERIDPTLNFTAQASTSDATVTLRITGFADAPKFELSSSPPLPQDEILARLLFGEPAAQLTALQAAETAAALVSLGGGGASLNPLAQVQKVLGLSTLTVGSAAPTGGAGGTSQSQGASITAGRYVTNRVYVAATHTTTGTTQVEVDVDLTKHLKLQTRLGNGTTTTQGITPENDPGSSVGIIYNFEY
ncbi:MAG TPA: translocation/assembly module TamB domain-containing protein [Steroidobacteraceae bacterium]|nr:translocation/assembly module TamB domain-containing protein [Steroidobacteraceae bacterium]